MAQLTERPNIEADVDAILADYPDELKRVQENRRFRIDAANNPIPESKQNVSVFGVKSVNINAILKDNIDNRSVFTVDHLCKMYREMTIAELLKNRKKKQPISFNMVFLLLLIIGVPLVIIIMILFFG